MSINDGIENGGKAALVAQEAALMGRRNPPLSGSALVLLSTAANLDDGCILPPPAELKARGGALKAVLNHLFARGLVEEMLAGSNAENRRRDGQAGLIGLRITAAGYAAIGVGAVIEGPSIAEPNLQLGEGAAPDIATDTNASVLDGNIRPGDETEVVEDDPLDGTTTWTDEGVAAVESQIDAHVDGVPLLSFPRSPSKRNQIIALLSRQDGATIDAPIAVTGWLPHTVRAVLSGLRKKGHRIDRQKDGDAGSVYRILPIAKVEAVPSATGGAV